MLYWKFSPNRVFFLDEYWVLIPIGILSNFVIIRRIILHKRKLKKLKGQLDYIERNQQIRKIMYLSLGINGCAAVLWARGGQDLINVDYIRGYCNLKEGMNYLDDKRLRNIIHDLYKYKRHVKVIYITATALCHLVNRYGQMSLALPVAVGDFGITNFYLALKKITVTILLGGIAPLCVIGGPVSLVIAFILGTSGLRIAFSSPLIPTSPISESLSKSTNNIDLSPRIPNENEVIVINLRNELMMGIGNSNSVKSNYECLLPEQAILNPNCNMDGKVEDVMQLGKPAFNYDEVVNMQDVTGLNRVTFSDVSDLGKSPKSCIVKPNQGKMVNFLDKFSDPEIIPEAETWDVCLPNVPDGEYLKIKNK